MELLVGTTADRWAVNKRWAAGHHTWWNDIEEVFEFIHPDLSQAPVVLVDDLAGSPGKAVRGGLPEHMANVRAGDDLQRATALPDLRAASTGAENGPTVDVYCFSLISHTPSAPSIVSVNRTHTCMQRLQATWI